MSSLVYLLVWSPLPHIPYISSPNQCLLFAAHAHTIATCCAAVSILYHLFLVFLSTPHLELLSFYLNITRPSDHSHCWYVLSTCGGWCSTDIPFFKQVVIMATVCDVCGKRDNEVKSGTGVEPTGTRITLRLTNPTDLSRDILKVSVACFVL